VTTTEILDVLTIILQLGMALLVIPACLVSSAILLIKLCKMLGEDLR